MAISHYEFVSGADPSNQIFWPNALTPQNVLQLSNVGLISVCYMGCFQLLVGVIIEDHFCKTFFSYLIYPLDRQTVSGLTTIYQLELDLFGQQHHNHLPAGAQSNRAQFKKG